MVNAYTMVYVHTMVNALLCSALWVKQRCLLYDFIVINDKWQSLPWVFMCDERGGKES